MSGSLYAEYFEKMAGPYFIIAGSAFLLLYFILKNKLILRRIQKSFPTKADYIREIGYSACTLLIFTALMLLLVENAWIRSYTTYYDQIGEYGWPYFFLAFPLMFLIHDAYFYWAHRLMHTKKLFTFFHYLHHRSSNPSPWTAYSFHPLEALIEGAVPILFLFLLPIHPLHLSLFYVLSVAYNVIGHLGYELYPKNFAQSWLGKWNNTSTYHNYHHRYFQGNYGFYFLFWDRLMGTLKK